MNEFPPFKPERALLPFTIEAHINDFIKTVDLLESSKNTYKSQLLNFASWLARQNICILNEQTIIDYCDHLNRDKNFSDLSINSYLTALKSFFAWLKSKNFYSDITIKIRGLQKQPGRRKESLSTDQVKLIFNTIDRKTLEGKRDFALINLMIWTGLRSIEITQILRGDIANCCGSQLLWIQAKECGSKDESIFLSDKLFRPIQDYLQARNSTSDTEPLFASHSKKNFGQSLTVRSVSRIIKNRLNDAKIGGSNISPISLRYTAIRLNLLAWATADQANSMIQTADLNTMLMYTRRLKSKHVV